MTANWFETWFDSPLYEALYAHRDENDARELVALLMQYMPAEKYPRVLDLACGRGRHSINLARAGYQVTGVDLSASAIQKAQILAAENALTINFRTGDMRLPQPGTFDAVVNLFTSFGYFSDDTENERVIEAVSQMLRDGGLFWLDFLNADKLERDLIPFDEGHIPGWKYTNRRWIEDGAVHKRIQLISNDGALETEFREYVKLLRKTWFEETGQRYGLELRYCYGNYQGGAFEGETSPRLLMGFEKTA